jgi:DNA-binding GntR family transcriptional regulator
MQSANAGFEAALNRGDVDRALAEDDRFHAFLVQASANREIARSLERLTPRIRRLEQAASPRSLAFRWPGRVANGWRCLTGERATKCWGRCWGN